MVLTLTGQRRFTSKPYSFLFIDTTLLFNPLPFEKNLLESVQRVIMTIYNKIRDDKLQYNINRAASKIFALSSGKIYKYEYHAGKETLSM